MEQRIWHSVRLENLQKVAAEVVIWLEGSPSIWRFDGQIGAGKTTFIKALCQVMGVRDVVQSPTFSLVNEYITAAGNTLFHFDFYRLETAEEAEGIGATEYFDSGNLCLIEWPERIESLLPDEYVQVLVQPQLDNSRTIQVIIHGTTH